MAAYIQGKPLSQIRVESLHPRRAQCVRSDATIAEAHEIMKTHRVRRLPVVDFGTNLVGILSLADVVRHARASRAPEDALHVGNVADALVEVFRPSSPPPPPPPSCR
jgi:CBS domain-containing protein